MDFWQLSAVNVCVCMLVCVKCSSHPNGAIFQMIDLIGFGHTSNTLHIVVLHTYVYGCFFSYFSELNSVCNFSNDETDTQTNLFAQRPSYYARFRDTFSKKVYCPHSFSRATYTTKYVAATSTMTKATFGQCKLIDISTWPKTVCTIRAYLYTILPKMNSSVQFCSFIIMLSLHPHLFAICYFPLFLSWLASNEHNRINVSPHLSLSDSISLSFIKLWFNITP